MKSMYKLLPFFIVKIAWAYDLVPNYQAKNYLKYNGTVTIKSDAPIGTKIIGPLDGHMKTRVNGNCPKKNTYIIAKASDHNQYIDIYEGKKVYATGIPGIGYAVNDYENKTADNEPWYMWGMTNNFGFMSGEMGGYAGVSFYKTGEIKPDTTVKDFNLANFYLWCNGGGPTRPMAIYKFSGMLKIKVENNNADLNNGGQSGNNGHGNWNNGGQDGNSGHGNWNNGDQGGNSGHGNWNNGGQGGNSGHGNWNNGGQGDNSNNNNNGQENKNPPNNNHNNKIWPNNNNNT